MRHNLLVISGDARLCERLQASLAADCTIMIIDPRLKDTDTVATRFDPSGIVIDATMHTGTKTILERISTVRAQFPSLPLVVIGDEMSAQLILAAFRAGANDFIDRESSDIEIRTLLLSVLRENATKIGHGESAVMIGVLSTASSDEDNDLALNIAALLAANNKDRRTLLLDLSLPASPAGPALGLDLSFTVNAAIREISRLDKTFLDSALAREPESGLYVLPLADNACDATNLPALRDVSVLLQILRALFDTVVVYWGAFSRQATLAGPGCEKQHLFLCCNQRFSSIRNAKEFLAELQTGGELAVSPILAIHVFDPDITPEAGDIVRATGATRHLTLHTTWSALAVAQNRGRPVSLIGPSHYGDVLRTHLVADGFLSQVGTPESRARTFFHWLSKASG